MINHIRQAQAHIANLRESKDPDWLKKDHQLTGEIQEFFTILSLANSSTDPTLKAWARRHLIALGAPNVRR